MIIKPRRLEKLLASDGFRLRGVYKDTSVADYVRPSSFVELDERLIVGNAGKLSTGGVPATALVHLSLGKWTFVGSEESDKLLDIATLPRWGYTPLKTDADAVEWEKRVAEVAPARSRKLALKKGPDLLRRTENARAAVKRYVSILGDFDLIESLEHRLIQRATPVQANEAERLAEWPGVCRIAGAQMVYHAATLAIVLFGEKVEGEHAQFSGDDPLQNNELMWRIQLLADAFLNRHQE